MATEKFKLSVEVEKGEVLSIAGGRIVLILEEKSGRKARLRFEFLEHTVVSKVQPLRVKKQGASLSP